jgi:hypothetical protein
MSENLMPVFEELFYMFGCLLPANDTVINEDDNTKQMGRQMAAMNLSQHVYVRLCIFQQPNTYLILFILHTASGAKGVVCGPEGAHLADNRVPTKLRKCHLFLPGPIHACPRHGPWATS